MAIVFPEGTQSLPSNVLKVYSTHFTGVQSITNSTRANITNLSITLTPQSSSSKFLCIGNVTMGEGTTSGAIYLMRGTSDIFKNTTSSGSINEGTISYHSSGDVGYVYGTNTQGFAYLDSPGTTSSITYKIQGHRYYGSNYFTVNGARSDLQGGDTNNYMGRSVSSLVIFEVL